MSPSDGEIARAALAAEINSVAAARKELEEKHGPVYDTDQLCEQFEVLGFASPCVVVRRKSDGKRGSLFFQHDPRFYWGFEEG